VGFVVIPPRTVAPLAASGLAAALYSAGCE